MNNVFHKVWKYSHLNVKTIKCIRNHLAKETIKRNRKFIFKQSGTLPTTAIEIKQVRFVFIRDTDR